MATWTTPTRAEEETRAVDTKHALNEQTIKDVDINDETVPSRVSINQLSTPTEMPKIPEEDAPNIYSVEVDNANHINLNDNFTKGKLNRMKFLSAIYDAMSRDCDECFEPDPVSKRYKWLLDRDNGNVLAVAMRAFSEGCGADIVKCEGNNPLSTTSISMMARPHPPRITTTATTIKCRSRYRVKCRTGSTTKKKKKTDER